MSGQNRHLKGDTNEMIMPVRGKTVIDAGDFVWQQPNDSWYLLPVSSWKDSSTTGACGTDVAQYFAGVALESSPSGVTENITVATAGVFRYPLAHKSAVTVGFIVSAVTNKAAGGSSNQYVENSEILTTGTTIRYGIIVKTQSATSFVDFMLMTKFSGATAQIGT